MPQTQWNTIAIVGVGLIGGSVGLALAQRQLAERVIGIGRRQSSLDKAIERGAITSGTLDLSQGVGEAELIVVCTPVAEIAGFVRDSAAACPVGALITDAGSTKQDIVEQLDGSLPRDVRFVGSHPLAGSEQRGPEHARADLFESRVVVVTPGQHTTAADRQSVSAFWTALGAKVVTLGPAEHDRSLAATSHLPHLAAAALISSVPEEDFELAAGGLRDSTRIAAGETEIWSQILLANKEHVLAAVEKYQSSFAALVAAIEAGQESKLKDLLAEAKRKRNALGS